MMKAMASWIAALALALFASPALAQAKGAVSVETITVHSKALEGNLEGDSPDRSVIVYLPPSYAHSKQRRYPVLYGLHGYSIDNVFWAKSMKAQAALDAVFAAGAPEMIVVLPSGQTIHNGSMFSTSVTIGDYDGFIAHDLVSYIDAHYRTIADRKSRGLFGHSMGGYGTTRIGMRHPEVWSALYIMSPCCLSARPAPTADSMARLMALKTPAESSTLVFADRTTFAAAAGWSPNPTKPPFYFDLPNGDAAQQADVLARWAANAPLSMLSQYIFNLRQYKAIAIDVGDEDHLKVDAAELHRLLDESKVENTFELYKGDHTNRVAERFQSKVLPFFAKSLSFPK
ncbi:MAG: alpha/beta hydrolase-fold protein [Alphaproteobacteria bacterium]